VDLPVVPLALAAVAFVVMEPLTYAAHRYLMHGPALGWHRSHHQPPVGTFERNDRFPLAFGTFTFLVMLLGATVPAVGFLLPVGLGVTAYGATYALVHDVYIHRRVPGLRAWRSPRLDRLAEAHALHHRFGGEPYGMLAPVVPAELRDRAAAAPERADRAPGGRPAAPGFQPAAPGGR
jgi:beta-carotene 3-hydroxylase